MRPSAICFLFIGFILFSCNPSNVDDIKDTEIGVVLDLGNPALDGCGWIIQVKNENLRAQQIDSSYLENGLIVRLKYTRSNDVSACGLANPIPVIEIQEISRF